MTRPRRTRPERHRTSQAAIACAVLPEPHVVGQEEPPAREEPLDALALIGVESLLESPECSPETPHVTGALDRSHGPSPVLLQQRVERRFGAPVA